MNVGVVLDLDRLSTLWGVHPNPDGPKAAHTRSALCEARHLSLFLLRRFHLGHKLGGLLVELLDAGFTAEINVGAFVGDFDGLAHLAEALIGDDTFFQRVGGGYAGVFGIGGGDEASAEDGGED